MLWGGRGGGVARGGHGWIGMAATLKGVAVFEKGVAGGWLVQG